MPHTLMARVWQQVMNLALFFTTFTVPILVAFESGNQGWLGTFQNFLNFIFYIDLFLNFIIAYENEDKNIVFILKDICKNYM
jgi:hypothetical protein